MNQDLVSYYKQRAHEYDKVYKIPEEQNDLITASSIFQKILYNRTVLEIACGTGYWTEQISKTAKSILAMDINDEVIEIAKSRNINNNVSFAVANMKDFSTDIKFEGLFGGFIWSHILLQDLDQLLIRLSNMLTEDAEIVFIDSKQIEGSIHDKKRITRTDRFGNTYQTRQLENGTTHEVLKNFPTDDFLSEKLSQIGIGVRIINLEHYWIATCKTITVGKSY